MKADGADWWQYSGGPKDGEQEADGGIPFMPVVTRGVDGMNWVRGEYVPVPSLRRFDWHPAVG